MASFVLDNNIDVEGTVKRGELFKSPRRMIRTFGKADQYGDISTLMEWRFLDAANRRWSVYDWKLLEYLEAPRFTRELIASMSTKVPFMIGGERDADPDEFIMYLEHRLNGAPEIPDEAAAVWAAAHPEERLSILTVFQQCLLDHQVSDEAAYKVFNLVFTVLEARLVACTAQVEAAGVAAEAEGARPVSMADMQQAVQRVLPPGELRRIALQEGEKHVRLLNSSTSRSGALRTDGAESLARRAGLCMGPSRNAQRALQLTGADGEAAGAYLAAVLEYVTMELSIACSMVDGDREDEEDEEDLDGSSSDDDQWVTTSRVQAAFEQHAELRALWQDHVATSETNADS